MGFVIPTEVRTLSNAEGDGEWRNLLLFGPRPREASGVDYAACALREK